MDPKRPLKRRRSARENLVRALESSAEGLRDEIAEEAGPSDDGSGAYDRRRAARSLLSAFARECRVETARLKTLEKTFAASLPEHLDDLSGEEILEWLERTVPIAWTEDRPLVPAGARAELASAILAAIQESVEGEMTPRQRTAIARKVFARIFGESRALTERLREKEHAFAELFIQLAWGSRREPERRAELAVTWLESKLHVRWDTPRGERAFSAGGPFAVGDVVVHSRFGRGTVKSRTDTSVEVVFADRVRKLAVLRPE